MDTLKKYQHPLNVKTKASAQMEMEHDSYVGQSPLSEDFESKLRENEARRERLEREHDEAVRLTKELEELNSKKRQFISSQQEITAKLSNAVTLIEREMLSMRKEEHELDQCHVAFNSRLKKITKFDPESWTRDNMHANLDDALSYMDKAADEYDEAARYFSNKNSAGVFGEAVRRSAKKSNPQADDFLCQLKNGFAFNLPLLSVALIALLVYILR